jgi:hypothetical protein
MDVTDNSKQVKGLSLRYNYPSHFDAAFTTSMFPRRSFARHAVQFLLHSATFQSVRQHLQVNGLKLICPT